jgi:hypothetical protein
VSVSNALREAWGEVIESYLQEVWDGIISEPDIRAEYQALQDLYDEEHEATLVLIGRFEALKKQIEVMEKAKMDTIEALEGSRHLGEGLRYYHSEPPRGVYEGQRHKKANKALVAALDNWPSIADRVKAYKYVKLNHRLMLLAATTPKRLVEAVEALCERLGKKLPS